MLYRLSEEKVAAWLARKLAAATGAVWSDAETKAELERGLLEARIAGAGGGGPFRVASGASGPRTAAAVEAAGASGAVPAAAPAAAEAVSADGAAGTPARVPVTEWSAAEEAAAGRAEAAATPSRAHRVEAARLVGRYLSDARLQQLCGAGAGGAASLDWRFVAGVTAQDKAAPAGKGQAAKAGATRARPAAYKPSAAVGVADVSRFVAARPSPPSGGDQRAAKRRPSSAGGPSKKLKGVDTSGMRSLASMFGGAKAKRK